MPKATSADAALLVGSLYLLSTSTQHSKDFDPALVQTVKKKCLAVADGVIIIPDVSRSNPESVLEDMGLPHDVHHLGFMKAAVTLRAAIMLEVYTDLLGGDDD